MSAARAGACPGALVLAAAAVACCSRGGVPAPAARSTALPPIEAAIIALPITLSLGAVRAGLDRALPRTDSLGQTECSALGGVVCHQYVYRRDTLEVGAVGDRIDVLARLRYRGRVALPRVGGLASCGYAPEPMRRAELRFATSLYWRTDWRLGSRATTLAAMLPDACEITGLRLDATAIIRRLVDAQLAKVTQEVDAALPAMTDLRPAADSLWRAMQEPIALDSASTLWLTLSPQSVGVAPLVGRAGAVTSGITIVARPRVVSGARPTVQVRPLPPLVLARPGTGLHVPVDVSLSFVEIGRRATELLRAETAGEGITVAAVRLHAAADTAVVQLDLACSMRGTLSLVGRPRYDERVRALVIDDLRCTVESRDLLTRLKATLGAPLIRRAVDGATGHGRLPLGEQLEVLRRRLTGQLNCPLAPGVAIGGGVSAVRVLGVHATDSAFVLRVTLHGEAGLWAR